MTIYIQKAPDGMITLRARAAEAGTVGDLVLEVRSGGAAFGHPYDWWATRPGPTVEVD